MTAKPVRVRVAPTISRSKSHPDEALEKNIGPATAADAAQYIAGLAPSLERLAAEHQLPFLAYLLAMVAEEARRLIARQGSSQLGTDTATR